MNYIETHALVEFLIDIVEKCFESRAENPRLFVIKYLMQQKLLEEQNKEENLGEFVEVGTSLVNSDALQSAPTVLANDSDEDMEPNDKTNVIPDSSADPYLRLFTQTPEIKAAELVKNIAILQTTREDEESLAQPMETENQKEEIVESPPEQVEPILPRRGRRRNVRKLWTEMRLNKKKHFTVKLFSKLKINKTWRNQQNH